MATTISTDDFFPSIVLTITNAAGNPAQVQPGSVVWATSDATQFTVTPTADGMGAAGMTVAPSPVDANGNPVTCRVTVTADADLGAGVQTITGVSDDITVTLGPSQMASVMTLNLGAATPKPPPGP